MREVLVALDDSDASRRVSDFVNAFFGGLDVSITAVNIGDTPLAWGGHPAAPGAVYAWPYFPAAIPPISPAVTVPAEQAQRDAERLLQDSGIRADERVVEIGGDVAETLRRVASERQAELLVIGSNHKGIFERLLSPSVSKELAHAAPTPVLIVH